MNPALEPEEEGGKCGEAGDGCERSITGGSRSLGGWGTMVRCLTFALLLGRRFGLRRAARSGSSPPRLKLSSAAEAEGSRIRDGGEDEEDSRGSSSSMMTALSTLSH